METNYTCAITFTKHTDLSRWFAFTKKDIGEFNSERYIHLKNHYAQKRDVNLILLARYEKGKTFCKIKCPINPLPIRGEFEAVSLNEVVQYLGSHGWTPKETLNLNLCK